jgi:hypothetical protein
MASSYSTDLKLELMVTGENSGTWGDKTNTNLNLVQQAIAGYEAVTVSGTGDTALVMTNAAISNARNAVIKLTGTITGDITVSIPDGIEKTYIVENGTTGVFTVQFKTTSGTGPTWSTTDKGTKVLYSDGTDVKDVLGNASQINLVNGNELRFEDDTGGEYIGLKAGATVASSTTFTLPTADGSSGNGITTNGSGTLSFTDVASTGKAIAMAIVFG